MNYSPLIQKAIKYAIRVHELESKQKRKGKSIPYITHPLTVGLILSRVTDEENTICAGLLHDVVEDCVPKGSVTVEMLASEFNEDIARQVSDLSEKGDKSLPWLERKTAALAHIKETKNDSQLVKSADVLQNMTELIDDIKADGLRVFDHFNAGRDDIVKRYELLIAELTKVWPENPLLPDLKVNYEKLLSFIL